MRDPWLFAILLLGALLRFHGLDHGLPFVYNPDEANIMARILAVAQDPNPHYFLYPSLFFYFMFGVMGVMFVVGRMLGRYPDLPQFERRFFADPTDFYFVGRVVTVVAALATIALTYRLAERHFGRPAARAAALFVAVFYFHVRDSHYLKHDVPAGFLMVVVIWTIDRMMEQGTTRSYVSSGIALGVAFATHYYMIFLAPTFFLCHVIAAGLRQWRRLAVAAATSAVTFCLLSPYVILELETALSHMRANRQVVMDRSFDSGDLWFPSLSRYAHFMVEQGLGYVLAALVIGGFILLARRSTKQAVLWCGFPLLFIPFLSYTFFAGRYLNPLAPSLAVGAGVLIGAVADRWGVRPAAALALVACLQPLYLDIQVGRLFSGQDTRSLAYDWFQENVPGQGVVSLQSYSVPLPRSVLSLEESLERNGALDELSRRGKFRHLVDIAETRKDRTYRTFFLGRGEEKHRIYISYGEASRGRLSPLRVRGVDKVILRYPPGPLPAEVAEFFAAVKAEGRLEARFSPFEQKAPAHPPYMDNEDWKPFSSLLHKGPVIEVWSLDAS